MQTAARHESETSFLFWLYAPFGSCGQRAELEQLLKLRTRDFAAGDQLKTEGDTSKNVLCVLRGWLSLSKMLSEGERHIIDFAIPGDFVMPFGADGTTSTLEIEALTDASVVIVPNGIWQDMQHRWPALYRLALQTGAATQARRSERMLRLGKGTAGMRVAYALLELCVRLSAIGQSEDGSFHVPLTQQHLGDFSGLSSVHVCRTLRRLAAQKTIVVKDHMDIRILDIAALSGMADIDPELLVHEIVPRAG